uniref:Uncharacterized protein n=1 Tax=Rhizophora mucronata TaxID=61149 RepID=A0A2P2QK55_RHIMU
MINKKKNLIFCLKHNKEFCSSSIKLTATI